MAEGGNASVTLEGWEGSLYSVIDTNQRLRILKRGSQFSRAIFTLES